jgi:hypothetical protein
VLQHRADPAVPDGRGGFPAEDLDPAGGRAEQAERGVDRRGLAGAVGAEQGDGLATGDVQVDPVDGHGGAVPDGQPLDVEGGGVGHVITLAAG